MVPKTAIRKRQSLQLRPLLRRSSPHPRPLGYQPGPHLNDVHGPSRLPASQSAESRIALTTPTTTEDDT